MYFQILYGFHTHRDKPLREAFIDIDKEASLSIHLEFDQVVT
jgi:hypothetical protein